MISPHADAHSQPTGARRYMSKGQRACDFCRSRKSACRIDVAPPCRLCSARGLPCEFTNRVVRKKSAARVQKSSASLNLSDEERIQESRSRLPSELVQPQQSMAFMPTTGSPVPFMSPGMGDFLTHVDLEQGLGGDRHDMDTSEQQHPSSVPSEGERAIMDELMLSIYETQGLSHIESNSTPDRISLDYHASLPYQLCGLTGDMDPYVLQHYRFNERSEFAFSKLRIRNVSDPEIPVQFMLSNRPCNQESTRKQGATEEAAELSQIVPPEIGERLIRLFYRFINGQFPILSEAGPPVASKAPAHLLAAIYSITQPFTTFDDFLCIELVYNPPSPDVLLDVAWKALNDALSEPTIASLQATLILLLQPPADTFLLDSTFKWALSGMAVSIAQTLGLHLDPSQWNLPVEEIRTRRRLSWLTYAVDKWLACSFGRPNHISRNNWLVTELDVEDIHPENDDNGQLYPFEFSKLTTILDKVLTDLYSLRSVSALAKDFRLTVSMARPLLEDLATWHSNLPPCLAIEPAPEYRSASSDLSASLHIAYQCVKILVFRALLRPFNNLTHDTTKTDDSEEWNAAKSHIQNAARAEAEGAINLVSTFRPAHYQAFWAPWCKTSFALITHLLFVLALIAHRDHQDLAENSEMADPTCSTRDAPDTEYTQCRRALDHARTVFRLHAKSLDMIRFALLRIDAVFWIGWERLLGYK